MEALWMMVVDSFQLSLTIMALTLTFFIIPAWWIFLGGRDTWRKPVEPDVVIWTPLLGACRTYGNVEFGELASNELFKLEASEASTDVLLSNIYAAAGKWEKVSLVRTMMQKRGRRKGPERSWIDVDNNTHEFVVGDKSHPEAKAMYTELNKLTGKLKATFRISGLCCMISMRRIKN